MEPQSSLQNQIIKGSKFAIQFGLLLLIIGILAIVYPLGFGKFTVIIIGSFLLIGGILRITFCHSFTFHGITYREISLRHSYDFCWNLRHYES